MSVTPIFEKLCEHYRDTVEGHVATLDRRNRLFFLLLLSVGLFTINITATDFSAAVISQVVEKSSGIKLGSGPEVFSSLLWLAVAGMAIRYFQLVVQIERQYSYLHALEIELNNYYPDSSVAFTREGVSYKSNYPIFSSWLHIVYTKMFPILLAVIGIINIYNELHSKIWTINSFIDVCCFLILETSVILYMLFQKQKSTKD